MRATIITDQYVELLPEETFGVMDLDAVAERIQALLVNREEVDYQVVAYFDGRATLKLAEVLERPEIAILEILWKSMKPEVSQTSMGLSHTDQGNNNHDLRDYAGSNSQAAERSRLKNKLQIIGRNKDTSDIQRVFAVYSPWYTFRKELAENATAIRRNQGTKSKLWVLGNEASGCPAANPKYTAEYVIEYCTEGLNKVTGRSDYLTLAAARNGLTVVVVGDGVSVYEVPEYRHLYNPEDAASRVTIEGSREVPIIVTTARDVMRSKQAQNDTFEFMYVFAKLYWELGVKDGSPMFPISVYEDESTYDYTRHLREAYAHAREKNLWPGTRMMEREEEYFAFATMIWYMALAESQDGSWQPEHFPVNTRCEMRDYDPDLYGVMVEVYGEFEYFSGYREQHLVEKDSQLRVDFPWFKHNQVDNFDIHGKPYAPLYVQECNLISANQIELIFNREVRDLDQLRDPRLWQIEWINDQGQKRIFTGADMICQLYQWKTLTLMAKDVKLYKGYIGSDVTGFTQAEMEAAMDPASPGYKPWLTTKAFDRTLDATVVSPVIFEQIRGKRPSGGTIIVKSEENEYVPLQIAGPVTPKANPGAIDKGIYVNFSDETTIPDYLKGGIDGSLRVSYLGNAQDWGGNALSREPIAVTFRPWLNQVMRSPKTGIYVYGDPYVKKSSLELTCEYWDLFLSNDTKDIGQRIADGLVYAGGGAEIMSYHHHAYQMSGQRSTYDEQNHFYLYVEGFGGGICQTSEANVVRDYTYTRYDNEFILGHEGAHSIEITGMPYFTDLNYLVETAYQQAVVQRDLWNHGGLSYAGSNRAEYFATLTDIWHSTMRESTDGTNNGTWLPINTREELYVYDPFGYEMCKRIYYNGDPGVDLTAVNADLAAGKIHLQDEQGHPILHLEEGMRLPGYDAEGRSINDEVIRWGSSFPARKMTELDRKLSEKYGEATYYRWVSWSCANQWDINDSHDPASGIRYGENPAARYAKVNYNPYLQNELPVSFKG